MRYFNRLGLILLAGLLLAGSLELAARTKKGEKLLKQGRQAQAAEEWDKALDLYEQALAEDPSDPAYQLSVRRARFEAGQFHVKQGRNLRKEGKLEEALKEFQSAFAIDPSATIAEQELRRTYRMIKQREEDKKNGDAEKEDLSALTPVERAVKEAEKRIASIQPVPDLKPISRNLNTLKMNNQPVKVLFETVGKLAGINVVFDPDFQAPPKKHTVDLSNTTLEEALHYLSVLTKTFWKPLSENTIFVTNDNVTKRRDYEEMVVKVFYLKNITKTQELQEMSTAVRSVTDIRRVFTYASQNAILIRGTRDKVALAEKLLNDLDKPLAEVVVDVIVMEANRSRTRDLAANIATGGTAGLNLPIVFAPRSGIDSGEDGDDGSSGGTSINLGQIGKLAWEDWSTTMPGMMLQALMTDDNTRILQRPQVRAADGQKASLRLGDRYPYATGSFQPGVGSVGVSPLVSTQFQFADVGVNVDLTPKIHGEEEISMHVEIEISAVRGNVDVGGLEQPIIGQRKVAEDIRVRDGEVTLLGGLSQTQQNETRGGIPGLGDIPIIKWLGFSNQSKEKTDSELLIALIPNIVRRPEITDINLRPVAAGTDQVVKLNMKPPHDETPEPPKPEEKPLPPTATAPSPVKPPVSAPEPAPPKPAAPKSAPVKPGGASASFNPGMAKAQVGKTFTVSLMLSNATDVFNAPVKVQFDPSVVKLNDVTRGALLGADGQQVIFTRNILNESGTASVVLNRLPGSGGISGSGSLVELVFEAVAPGETQIQVPGLTIRDSQMQSIPVEAPTLAVTVQ